MLEKKIYPWHATQWEQVMQSHKAGRLPHALLLVGVDGLGKGQFARSLAHSVLCLKPSEGFIACGECHACRLSHQESHPDLVTVAPEEPGKSIGIDPIRELVSLMSETTLLGGYRVIIITPANKMNTNAANALLKTLEEPTPKTLLILISDPGLRLPATIMSRCQKMVFHKPALVEATSWLQAQTKDESYSPDLLLRLADGAPLKALSLMNKEWMTQRQELYAGLSQLGEGRMDPVALASKWHDKEPLVILDLVGSWLGDILRYQGTGNQALLVNQDFSGKIARMGESFSEQHIVALIDHLRDTRATLLAGISLNKQLVMEDTFIRWVNYVSG